MAEDHRNQRSLDVLTCAEWACSPSILRTMRSSYGEQYTPSECSPPPSRRRPGGPDEHTEGTFQDQTAHTQ